MATNRNIAIVPKMDFAKSTYIIFLQRIIPFFMNSPEPLSQWQWALLPLVPVVKLMLSMNFLKADSFSFSYFGEKSEQLLNSEHLRKVALRTTPYC